MCSFHVSLSDQIFIQRAAHFLLYGRSRTLQPHLFHFTACSVKAGQEALLDYGQVITDTLFGYPPSLLSELALIIRFC